MSNWNGDSVAVVGQQLASYALWLMVKYAGVLTLGRILAYS